MNLRIFLTIGLCALIMNTSQINAQDSGQAYRTLFKKTAEGKEISFYNLQNGLLEKIIKYNNQDDIYEYNEVEETFWPNGMMKSTTTFVPGDKAIHTHDAMSVGLILTRKELVKDGPEKFFNDKGEQILEKNYLRGREIPVLVIEQNPLEEKKGIVWPANHFVPDGGPQNVEAIVVPVVNNHSTGFITDWHMPENTDVQSPNQVSSFRHVGTRSFHTTQQAGTFAIGKKEANNTSVEFNNYILAKELTKKLKDETSIPEKERLAMQIEYLFETFSINDLSATDVDQAREMYAYVANQQKELFPDRYNVNEKKIRETLISSLEEEQTANKITANKTTDKLVDLFIEKLAYKVSRLRTIDIEAIIQCYYYFIDKAEIARIDNALKEKDAYLLEAIMLYQYLADPNKEILQVVSAERPVINNFTSRLINMSLNLQEGTSYTDMVRTESRKLIERPIFKK